MPATLVRSTLLLVFALAQLPLTRVADAAWAPPGVDLTRPRILFRSGDLALLQERVTREAATAKLFATEAAQRIIDRAVQIHGGLGVERGSVVERLYREVRPLRIYEGTSEIQRLVVARTLLGE